VLTVAQQDDGPKRVRDARKHFQPEGIVILGHQGSPPRIAEGLGLQTPAKGSWIAGRVVLAGPTDLKSVDVDGELWRIAAADEPLSEGPSSYQ